MVLISVWSFMLLDGTVTLNSSSTANITSITDSESMARSSKFRRRLQDFGRKIEIGLQDGLHGLQRSH